MINLNLNQEILFYILLKIEVIRLIKRDIFSFTFLLKNLCERKTRRPYLDISLLSLLNYIFTTVNPVGILFVDEAKPNARIPIDPFRISQEYLP